MEQPEKPITLSQEQRQEIINNILDNCKKNPEYKKHVETVLAKEREKLEQERPPAKKHWKSYKEWNDDLIIKKAKEITEFCNKYLEKKELQAKK